MIADVPVSAAQHEVRAALIEPAIVFGLARIFPDLPPIAPSVAEVTRHTRCARVTARRVRCEWRLSLVYEGEVMSRTEGIVDVTRRHGRLSVQPVEPVRRGLG